VRVFAVFTVLVAIAIRAAPGDAGVRAPRAVLCVPVPEPPVIDGRLDDAAWQSLPPQRGFVTAATNQLADPPTTLWIGRDDEAVYVALRCAEPRMDAVRAAVTEADGGVFDEECAVILFDVGRQRRPHGFVELAANLLGTKHDAFEDDHSWNGAWRVAAQRGADGWAMEMAIPFSDLRGRPESGDLWGFNAGRYRHLEGVEQVFVWSPPAGSFWDSETFGYLIFDSLERNLARDLEQLEQRLRAEEPEVKRLAAKFGRDDRYVRAALVSRDAIASLRQRTQSGVCSADEWSELKALLSRAEAAYDDALWNLRFEELFAA